MQRIMEVYDLSIPWQKQSGGMTMNTPPRGRRRFEMLTTGAVTIRVRPTDFFTEIYRDDILLAEVPPGNMPGDLSEETKRIVALADAGQLPANMTPKAK
jgi:hypothetical protein